MKHKLYIWQDGQWVELPGVSGFQMDLRPNLPAEWTVPSGPLPPPQMITLSGTITPEGRVLLEAWLAAQIQQRWPVPPPDAESDVEWRAPHELVDWGQE